MNIIRFTACAVAALAVGAVWAEETESTAEGESAPVEGAAAKKPPEKTYYTLPLCRSYEGVAEVRRPLSQGWTPVEEGKFYPLGSAFRTVGARARVKVLLGAECELELEGEGSFATRLQGLEEKSRTVELGTGVLMVRLPRNLPVGMFVVAAPGFTVTDLAGESRFEFSRTGDGDLALVRCVTGSMSVKGRHFAIPAMRAADALKIRSSQDVLFTGLYGTSGDFDVKLDQGLAKVRDITTGEEKVEAKSLDWRLSPQTAVRIQRGVSEVGGRMCVTVMTFDSAGGLVNRCAFAEGRYELSTGEQGEVAIAAKEDLAKKAAEAAETVAEAEPEEGGDKESNETKKEESTEE